MATVLVIDASPSVRETLRIVLGNEHDVAVGPSLDRSPAAVTPDIVVLGLPATARDHRSVGATLASLAPGAPILLLHAAGDVDVHALVPPHLPVEFLPKPFDAYAVRTRVRALLAARLAMPASADLLRAQRRYLEFPFLSQTAAAIVRRALTVDVPVILLQGEPGTGASAIARALHVGRGRRGPFTALDAARLDTRDLQRCVAVGRPNELATIYLANIDHATENLQDEILQLVETNIAVRSSSLRIIAGARDDLGELAAAGRFHPELAYVVTTLPIVLAPLRDRPEDLAALVEALTRDLCTRLQLAEITYSAAALERLRQYLWFGNIAELQAVLGRTLTLHQSSVVEADQLVFLAEDAPRALTARTAVTGQSAVPLAPGNMLAGLDLEVVLGELAHELRNPMVTIKTFAQHLDSVLADPDTRARFSTLTTEAISRMDGLLETLLDFSRFRAPTLQSIDVQAILDRALSEHTEELARRSVTVERNGVGVGPVDGDESQVLFALRSLWRGLVSDLVPRTPIKIRSAEPGVIEMQVQMETSTAARLATWVEPRSNAAAVETPPLAWALAAALLGRNGGALTVRKGDVGTTVIRIGWTRSADRASSQATTGGEDGEQCKSVRS